MDITVLVPDDRGIAALAEVTGVRPVRYEWGEPLPAAAGEAQVFVPPFTPGWGALEVLAELPALRYVQLLTAGAEPWAGGLPDGLLLSTCRGAHGGSTAELVVGALVAGYREFGGFAAAQRDRRWDRHRTDTLQDKRVLVVGAGDLGVQLTRRLAAFDAQVTLIGRTARPGVHTVDELPELLGEHDVVVLMVPLTDATTGMVDAEFLARMPDGATLVNVARGAVVDTDALLAELTAGRLTAILDVTDPEPLPADHPLWTAPGLTLFPHVGGNCRGLEDRAWRVAAGEIARFAAGKQLENQVRGDY
ncbi:MAG TPA: 2-hydroxyacid dehydrogenase [Pseudonocardiaceae bacterium]|nr:2-hydroxyacid dehydrogenase [Pseudonocardiaceae bacterium]